jgi:chloramphenicol O-acetyltransferase type A
MYKKIKIKNWNRREHFEFFSKYDEPFWGIVSEINVSAAYKLCKEKGYSFFSYYLHKSIIALNKIEAFRCRIENGEVLVYDKIHTSPTIGRDDGTFAFSFAEYHPEFSQFDQNLKKEIDAVKQSQGLRCKAEFMRKDVVHYSSLPWTTFTGLSHARNFNDNDSIPKVTFGKMFKRNDEKMMSVALNAHHGLADGYHASLFFELFQNLMNSYTQNN